MTPQTVWGRSEPALSVVEGTRPGRAPLGSADCGTQLSFLPFLPEIWGTIPNVESSLKALRTVQVAMLISIGLYVFLAQGYGPPPSEVSLTLVYTMAVLAVFMMGAILLVRRIIVKPAEMAVQGNPENTAALMRWRFGYMVTFALSEAVALYGVVLRFVGIRFSEVLPFFVAGFILLLFFGPRRPSNAIG